MISLFLRELRDQYARQNFDRILRWIRDQKVLLAGFRHFELEFSSNGTFQIPHRLGYLPQDVLQTWKSGTGTITWNYASFTDSVLSITIAGSDADDPLRVRAFVGSYREVS